MDRVTISAGESVCTISPAAGGSVASWHVGGQPLLRAAAASDNPLDMASFPLVPYSNRIGGATFDWAGQTISLARKFEPEPHAIHGVGWARAWAVDRLTADSAVLTLLHAADDHWPWAFEARQHIHVASHELRLTLSVINRAAQAVPLAFGHHPYFDQAGASLCFEAEKVWTAGEDHLPITAQDLSGQDPNALFDFRTGACVEGRSIDHCYSAVSGTAHIKWAGRPLALDILSPLPAAVVYIPLGGDAFCFEPVPHINNALNRAGDTPAMPVIEAGAAFETSILFRAVIKGQRDWERE